MRQVAIAAFAVAIGACATTGKLPDKVSDADLGRLPPGQAQPIEQARQNVFRAEENLNRAKLALQQAKQEEPLAKADGTAADSDLNRAEAEKKIADETRNPSDINRYQETQQVAQLHKHAADAHSDYIKKMIGYRQAELEAAQRQVEVANAQLEVSKLQALQQANIPSATKYDGPAMQKNVNDAERAFTEAQQKAQTAKAHAASAQSMYNNLREQYQARAAGGTPRG
jgi:chromosome segregation ATPase